MGSFLVLEFSRRSNPQAFFFLLRRKLVPRWSRSGLSFQLVFCIGWNPEGAVSNRTAGK